MVEGRTRTDISALLTVGLNDGAAAYSRFICRLSAASIRRRALAQPRALLVAVG